MSSLKIIDEYRTIKISSKAEIKIKKSVFIAQSFPVFSVTDVKDKILSAAEEYHDARHHPFAYRIGIDANNFRYNDDGEPSGSSGKPILEVIDKYCLTDVLIIVTRYFGGIKLGTGGLRRAYYNSAFSVIDEKNIIEKFIYENINLEFKYDFINNVMNFIEKNKIQILENNSEESVKYTCKVRLSLAENFKQELTRITNGSVKFY